MSLMETNVIVSVIYCPPDTAVKAFNESLSSSLDSINKEKRKRISKSNISTFKDMLASISRNVLNKENNAHFAYQHFINVISNSFN